MEAAKWGVSSYLDELESFSALFEEAAVHIAEDEENYYAVVKYRESVERALAVLDAADADRTA